MGGTLIKLSNIHKTFQQGSSEVDIFRQLNFVMKCGESVAIVGQSGLGKTTLLNLIALLDTDYSGQYSLLGKDTSHLTTKELFSLRMAHIGYMCQYHNLLVDMTVMENVQMPLGYAGVSKVERKERSLAIVEKIGLADKASEKAANLSGGQQMRVALARALVSKPDILIADEPTGNLDASTSQDIMELFQSINSQGMSMVVVTHDLEVAHNCNRTVELRDRQLWEVAK